MDCRFCKTPLEHEFIDLGSSPPANSFLSKEELNQPEVFYPLKLWVCSECFLVQVDEYKASTEIFNAEYPYYSSCSDTWLTHARAYTGMVVERFRLNEKSHVVEIASNDGYLLQYVRELGIPCLGIDPAEKAAQQARQKGLETMVAFFGEELARGLAESGRQADLLLGNNVLAHVPDINDFVKGLKTALKKTGVITMEFPHLMRLVEKNQFDTIYHEHFSYLSLITVKRIFEEHGLTIFDVEELATHGGSLRIYARKSEEETCPVKDSVELLLRKERGRGLDRLGYYENFQQTADRLKMELVAFLLETKRQGKRVVGYGAAAKGNTLLNYCGIRKDLVGFVADRSPVKQEKFLPGSHIPVKSENEIRRLKPEFVLILPWNIKEEIMDQLNYIRDWGGRFVLPVPEVEVA